MLRSSFILLFLLGLAFLNCQKECGECPEGMEEASIIGPDLRLCACCGGWFIDLGQDTVRTFGFPEGFDIEPLSEYPVEVCLSYQDATGPCSDFGKLIVVNQVLKK